jgi:uncharacterized YigZ family protein
LQEPINNTDTYKTITVGGKGYITEQRSKFISFAFPVQTPEEAKNIVDSYRKEYHDARHVCWAYMLGPERNTFRVNDDGEPSSTAGKPILGVINSHELTDILIVVIRYFGGVKLGTSGLIAAYREAARSALQNTGIIEKTINEEIFVAFEYPLLDKVMRIVKEDNPQIVSQKFDMNCELTLRIRKSEAEQLKTKLSKAGAKVNG